MTAPATDGIHFTGISDGPATRNITNRVYRAEAPLLVLRQRTDSEYSVEKSVRRGLRKPSEKLSGSGDWQLLGPAQMGRQRSAACSGNAQPAIKKCGLDAVRRKYRFSDGNF